MAHRHLHELLLEDQEPFHLNNYIADRRCQIKTTLKPPIKSSLQLNKIHSKLSMCNHACFFSFHHSPDVRSPFLPSPAKSPCKTTNTIFLQVPSRTATKLLEAAARIKKQSSAKPRSSGFGLLGSILKRLNKNRIKKREIGVSEVRVSGEGKSTRTSEKVKENAICVDEKIGFSCSCSHSRFSSIAWSESNEDKEMETSSCSTPSGPFRFSLQRSPSTGRRTPEFLSPSSSPAHVSKEEKDNYEECKLEKEEEEEKEQCSPVSVLDPPFEDDEIGHEEDGVDDYDMGCSYAIVQKVKHQLLHKLRRFERLAEWDPLELEKRMLEEEDDYEEEDLTDETDFADQEEEESAEIINEVLGKAYSHYYLRKIPSDINMLVSDLVLEENKNRVGNSEVSERVCKRLESWKEVKPNTIDMMVELDFRREIQGWKRSDEEEMRVTAGEIESGIFGLLMEELSDEFVSLVEFNGVHDIPVRSELNFVHLCW